MAWTAPMTAVAGAPFTAAQFNQFVRDNLLETAVAKATQSGSYFVGTGPNSIAERKVVPSLVANQQNTSSTSYTDLTTFGPSVTIETGAYAMVFWAVTTSQTTAVASTWTAVDVSGATTIAANDQYSVKADLENTINFSTVSAGMLFTLTPGINTFTLKYKVAVGTGQFRNRSLFVMPF